MQLQRVSAHDFGLREVDAGVANRIHARFEIGDVLFEMDAFGRLVETPTVNAASNEIEAGVNVVGEAREHGLQLLREAVFVAVFDGEFESQKRVVEGTAELCEQAQAFAPSGTAGLVACSVEKLIIAAQQGLQICTQPRQILGGTPRKPLRTASKNAPSTRNSCARPSRSHRRARSEG